MAFILASTGLGKRPFTVFESPDTDPLTNSLSTKLLLIIPTLQGGGAERVVTTLLQHFDRKQFQLILCVVDMRGAVFLDLVPSDVKVVDLGSARVRYAIPKLIRLIWREQPQAVMSTLGHLNLCLALIKPFLPSAMRLIARETAVPSSLAEVDRVARLLFALYPYLNTRFNRIICQSLDMRDDLINKYRVPAIRIETIPNPVDIAKIVALSRRQSVKLARSANAVHLVSVGRLCHQKGFDILIDALAELNRDDVFLTILGEGPLEESLRLRCHERGLAGRITFSGFQVNPYQFMVQADALISASRYEGMPNVVLEALAVGTPVISTPSPGGIHEILDAIPECLVAESISANSLCRTLKMWLDGKRKRVPFQAVVPYDVASIVRRYEQVLLQNGIPRH